MKRLTIGGVFAAAAILGGLVGVGFGIGITLRAADASRNSAGTMVNANGPYITGQVINSTLVNARLSDIESEITNSLSRDNKGQMRAQLGLFSGTSTAPGLGFASEATTGIYRNGAGDIRFAFNGTDVQKWQSTGITFPLATTFSADTTISSGFHLGIGGAPTAPLTITQSGTAAMDMVTLFEASLANGNNAAIRLGKANTGASDGLGIYYQPSGTAANSKGCLAISGQTDTLCVDGNGKTLISGASLTVGSSGTATVQVNFGSGTFNGATPASFTATVASGATCFATRTGVVTQDHAVKTQVASTTLTVTSALAADTTTANYLCF